MSFHVPHILYSAFTTHSFPAKNPADGSLPPQKTEIGIKFMTPSVSLPYPISHVNYYPVGSGASYVQTKEHYEKFVFLCDFGDKWIVGWYYKRRLEETACQTPCQSMPKHWGDLWRQDTRINTNALVLKARDAHGELIRGKVWLAFFGFPCSQQNERFNPYKGVPKQIIHAKGWDVPSWALTPAAKVLKPDLVVRQPYPMPAYEDLVEQACAVLVKTPSPSPTPQRAGKDSASESKSPCTVEVPASRHSYQRILPKPSCEAGEAVVLPVAYKFLK